MPMCPLNVEDEGSLPEDLLHLWAEVCWGLLLSVAMHDHFYLIILRFEKMAHHGIELYALNPVFLRSL